jgi:hypothetical protein
MHDVVTLSMTRKKKKRWCVGIIMHFVGMSRFFKDPACFVGVSEFVSIFGF